MDTQIAQIVQRVRSLSKPQVQLPSHPMSNPRGHINAISVVGERLVKSSAMVVQEAISVPISVRTEERENLVNLGSNEKITTSPLIHPYQPPIPYAQRMV